MPAPAASGPAAASRPQGELESHAEQEFACFYREHLPRLVLYLIYQGAPAHLAAEFAQEAMITAYQRWHAITTPRAYAYTVASRAFIRHALHAGETPVAEVPEPAAVLPHPGRAETWLQEQEIINVLRALPPRQRQVLALTIDDWTPAEIADLLGIDPAAVRSSLLKARRTASEHRRHTGKEDL